MKGNNKNERIFSEGTMFLKKLYLKTTKKYCFYDILILERWICVSLEVKCYSQKTEYQKIVGVGTNVSYDF